MGKCVSMTSLPDTHTCFHCHSLLEPTLRGEGPCRIDRCLSCGVVMQRFRKKPHPYSAHLTTARTNTPSGDDGRR